MEKTCFILMTFLWQLLVPGYSSIPVGSTNPNVSKRLIHDVIHQFDNHLRPIWNQSKAIDVFITFNINSLLDVDEVQQRIQINAWVNFSWWDEFRTWDPDDYNGIDVIHPTSPEFWRPRTIVTNAIGHRDVFEEDAFFVSLFHTGSTHWHSGAVLYLSCKMDLTYFPFDKQTCRAHILSAHLPRELKFISTSRQANLAGYSYNGEWQLISSLVSTDEITVDDMFVPITISLTIQRYPLYYIVNILTPVMILSYLSFLAFILPKECGERASFSITVLLSLAVFLGVVSDQLPPNSDTFPIVSVYLFILLSLSSFSVLIFVLQLRFWSDFVLNKRRNFTQQGRLHCRDEENEKGSTQEPTEDKINFQCIEGYRENGIRVVLSIRLAEICKQLSRQADSNDESSCLILANDNNGSTSQNRDFKKNYNLSKVSNLHIGQCFVQGDLFHFSIFTCLWIFVTALCFYQIIE